MVAKYWDNALIALLPEKDKKETAETRRHIERAINSATHLNLSVSIGSATSPDDGDGFEDMLQAAQMDCIANRTSFDFLASKMNGLMHTGDLN